jgi:hypothetical protein
VRRKLVLFWSLFSLLAAAIVFSQTTPAAAQTNVGNNEDVVPLDLSLSASRLFSGQKVALSARVRNPRRDITVQLQATATYTDSTGQVRTVSSNVVTLTLDYSLPVRISLALDRVRLVPGTVKFDGTPIEPVSGTTNSFDIVLPGDGNDHLLVMEIMR